MKKKAMGKALLLCALAAGSLSLTGCGIESVTGGGGKGGGFGLGSISGLIPGIANLIPKGITGNSINIGNGSLNGNDITGIFNGIGTGELEPPM